MTRGGHSDVPVRVLLVKSTRDPRRGTGEKAGAQNLFFGEVVSGVYRRRFTVQCLSRTNPGFVSRPTPSTSGDCLRPVPLRIRGLSLCPSSVKDTYGRSVPVCQVSVSLRRERRRSRIGSGRGPEPGSETCGGPTSSQFGAYVSDWSVEEG